MTSINRARHAVLIGSALALAIAAAPMARVANADINSAHWNPSASERLIKLPPNYLKKAIDRDFKKSSLGEALRNTDENIKLKRQTLIDLKKAIGQSQGEVQVELKHQYLAEKREFLRLMSERQDIRRRHLETKLRLYDKLLGKLQRRNGGASPQQMALMEKQIQARARFERSVDKVDMKLFGESLMPESRYSKSYRKNMQAIEKLAQAINSHPMNKAPELDGRKVSRQEYVRQLVATTQSEIAILDQEGSMLGYMAKLVSLDAQALAEGLNVADGGVNDTPDNDGVALNTAVDLFLPE